MNDFLKPQSAPELIFGLVVDKDEQHYASSDLARALDQLRAALTPQIAPVIRQEIYGWFDDSGPTPAHDPGLIVGCPLCDRPMESGRNLCTISTLPAEPGDERRSYFFRAHKTCWEAASADVQGAIETAPFASSRRAALQVHGEGGTGL